MGTKKKVAKKTAVMKKKAKKKPSIIARGRLAKYLVFNGSKKKTSGGLEKSGLMVNKHGKIVSKRLHAHGVKQGAPIRKWNRAFCEAKKNLGIVGFRVCK